MANRLDYLSAAKRSGIQRELAFIGAAKARGDSANMRVWERNIVNLEHSVRPADLPPGRERWVLSRILSAEEMHVPLRELRDRGRLKSNLVDLLRHCVAGSEARHSSWVPLGPTVPVAQPAIV